MTDDPTKRDRPPLPPGFSYLDDFLDKYVDDPRIAPHLPKAREWVRRALSITNKEG